MVASVLDTKVRRHRRHANPFTFRAPIARVDLDALFARAAPLALDIGCGPGLFVLELAAARPELNVLGIEIRQHLVSYCNEQAAAHALSNAAAILANANLQLPGTLPANSVRFVSVNFPDPWYKKRHQKRRVVSAAFLDAIAPTLMMGAEIHAMTDFLPIAEQMRTVFDDDPRLSRLFVEPDFAAQSTTGLTSEREITHTRRGEPVYRLVYRFDGPQPKEACEPIPSMLG